MITGHFKGTVRAAALIAILAGAGAASAQTLTNRADPAWAKIGTADGTEYFVLPSSHARDGQTVRLLIKAEVAPLDGVTPNTVVAEVVVDCAASAIGVGALEFYTVTRGFQSTQAGNPTPRPASDPGQSLVIQHACAR